MKLLEVRKRLAAALSHLAAQDLDKVEAELLELKSLVIEKQHMMSVYSARSRGKRVTRKYGPRKIYQAQLTEVNQEPKITSPPHEPE
jgi:predicted metallopeptidase